MGIQLKDTELCLDAIGKGTGLSGAPIELRECGSKVARWQFEEPLLLPGMGQDDDSSHEARHVMITLFALAGIGGASLGAWIWQRGAKWNQDRDVIPAVMAVSLLPKNELRQLEDVYKKMNKDRRVALFIITNALKDPRTEELMAKGDAAAMALSEFPLEFSDATVAKVKEMKEKSKDVKDIDASKINVEVKDKLDAFLQKYGNDSEVMDALQGWLKVIIDVGSKVDVGSKGQDVVPAVMAVSLLPKNELRQLED